MEFTKFSVCVFFQKINELIERVTTSRYPIAFFYSYNISTREKEKKEKDRNQFVFSIYITQKLI
jgi:hypothetical protein